MSTILTKNATVVTLPSPAQDYPLSQTKRQAMGRSAGGTVYAYDKGLSTFEVELTIENLTSTDRSNLQSFFSTTVNGVTATWTLTDSSGGTYTARFLDPVLQFEEHIRDNYRVRLRLELSALHA